MVDAMPLAAAAARGETASLPAPRSEQAPDGDRDPVSDAHTANLVVRAGSEIGNDLPTNQGSGSGLLGVFLVNEGPAVARDLRLFATFPDGAVRSSETQRSLSAHKEMTIFAQVLPRDFGPGASIDVLYRITYRDGNGDQALERKVRLDGGWKGPWKTFLNAESGANIGRLSSELASAPVENTIHE
jgi:hypothetical protein